MGFDFPPQQECILAPASMYWGDFVDHRQDQCHFCPHIQALVGNRHHNSVLGWGHTHTQAQAEILVVGHMHNLDLPEEVGDTAQRQELNEYYNQQALGHKIVLVKGQPCSEN